MATTNTPDQAYRRARLRALLEHPDFGGVQAQLGALIGLKSGAFIRQMLEEDRPISEKTVIKFETAKGGKYAGWFTNRGEADTFEQQAAQALRAISGDDKLRERALAYLQGLADLAAGNRLGESSTPSAGHGPTGAAAA